MNWTKEQYESFLSKQMKKSSIDKYKADLKTLSNPINFHNVVEKWENKKSLPLKTNLTNKFHDLWNKLGGLELVKEFKFCPNRKWRSDYAITEIRILIEIEGGVFMKKAGHNSISGILRDIEKYNEASYLGFKVFRLSAATVNEVNIKRLIQWTTDLYFKDYRSTY